MRHSLKKFKKRCPEWMRKHLLAQKILTSNEVAILLKIDIRNVNRLMRLGKLKSLRDKRPHFFETSAIKEFIRERSNRPYLTNPNVRRLISKKSKKERK